MVRQKACASDGLPMYDIESDEWKEGTHVFFLNSLLAPVLHESTFIVGYIARKTRKALFVAR